MTQQDKPAKKMPAWLWPILGAFISALGLWLLFYASPQFLGIIGLRKEAGQPAPDFALSDLSGRSVNLRDFAGRNTILLFWTSWNEASVGELKDLNDYAASFPSNNLVILAIDSEEASDAVRSAVTLNDAKLEVLTDADGVVGDAYNVGVLPLTLFINKSGIIDKRVAGRIAPGDLSADIAGLGG